MPACDPAQPQATSSGTPIPRGEGQFAFASVHGPPVVWPPLLTRVQGHLAEPNVTAGKRVGGLWWRRHRAWSYRRPSDEDTLRNGAGPLINLCPKAALPQTVGSVSPLLRKLDSLMFAPKAS